MVFKHPEESTEEVPSIQQYRRIFHLPNSGIANALIKAMEELDQPSMPQEHTMRFEHDALPRVDI
jgi:hypothetical protein